jgi:hypothetical protein
MAVKFLLFIVFLSFSVDAATLTKYRIYLDEDNRVVKFRVMADKTQEQQCNVDFDYVYYEEGSKPTTIAPETKQQLIDKALSNFRYSPREFSLKPGEEQFLTFRIKRSVNQQSEESRTYLKLVCTNKVINTTPGQITLSPRLVHTVPMIIRNGKLEVEANIADVTKTNSNLSFNIQITGNRSVFGDLRILDKNGNEIEVRKGIAIYPEAKYRSFNFNFGPQMSEVAQIIFEENKVYGGELVITKSI